MGSANPIVETTITVVVLTITVVVLTITVVALTITVVALTITGDPTGGVTAGTTDISESIERSSCPVIRTESSRNGAARACASRFDRPYHRSLCWFIPAKPNMSRSRSRLRSPTLCRSWCLPWRLCRFFGCAKNNIAATTSRHSSPRSGGPLLPQFAAAQNGPYGPGIILVGFSSREKSEPLQLTSGLVGANIPSGLFLNSQA
jgi:hypothetical protein